MQNNLNKVSLGFAEFVSQLIQETFDAIIGSQFYQIDKYAELLGVLNTPNNLFRKKYISEEEFINFQETLIGFIVKPSMIIDLKIESLKIFFQEEVLTKMMLNNKLTEYGFHAIQELCENKLIEDKKNSIRKFINEQNSVRLTIDSGEIKTKLDLFCLNQTSTNEDIKPKKTDTKDVDIKSELQEVNMKKEAFLVKDNQIKIGSKSINLQEIIDSETKQKTILIKKQDLISSSDKISSIPTARLVANPLSSSSTTNVFSEVTIKFSYK
jgi:hypothetical protein